MTAPEPQSGHRTPSGRRIDRTVSKHLASSIKAWMSTMAGHTRGRSSCLARQVYSREDAAGITTPESRMSLLEIEDAPVAMPAPMTFARPTYYPGMLPAATRVELSLFDT